MKIEPTNYRRWRRAYRCTAGAAELIVVADVGPRILSLRWQEGPNLVYEDTTDFGVGDWRLYGGHRFTVAPEGNESYFPDNFSCVAGMSSHELRISARPGPNGVQRTLVIRAAKDGAGFDLLHILKNHGPDPWRGALWAITCVPPSTVLGPRGSSPVRFWPGTNEDCWRVAADYIASAADQSRGKIGWHSTAAWLASLQAEAAFVIHNPNPPPTSQCVDGGCNVEVFTCQDYMELETLSGEVTIPPGRHAAHSQRWRLFEPGFTSADCSVIAALVACSPNGPIAHAA